MTVKTEILLRSALDVFTAGNLQLLPEAVHSEARSVIDKASLWTTGRNIVGFGISEKIVLGHPADDICLKVYVTRKLPKSIVPSTEQIPQKISIPSFEQDVYT